MTAMREIVGDEVIGRPGQNLTEAELRVLVGLGDGLKPADIARELGTNLEGVHALETNLAGKLGARSKWHLMSRGFTLGVLTPRALCAMLAIMCAAEVDHDALRPRNGRRGGTLPTASRTVRTSPSDAGSGTGKGLHPTAYAVLMQDKRTQHYGATC